MARIAALVRVSEKRMIEVTITTVISTLLNRISTLLSFTSLRIIFFLRSTFLNAMIVRYVNIEHVINGIIDSIRNERPAYIMKNVDEPKSLLDHV